MSTRWRFAIAALALLASVPVPRAEAHIGSPDTVFQGDAGPYRVRVMVRAPGVVPGLAEINVWVQAGSAQRVAVRPVRWDAGPEGAPPADVALPVRGEAGLWSAKLWLMDGGSYSVYVDVDGDRGKGTAIVPVVAAATQRLGLMRWLAVLLVVLGSLLVAGAVTAIGAGVREGVLGPGEVASPGRRRAARWAMVSALAVIAVALYGGKTWWDSEDARFAEGLYEPLAIRAEAMVSDGGQRVITLTIDDEDFDRGRWSAIVPDHGKLMHAFLVAEDGLDGFAHVHPLRQAHDRFAVVVPAALPAGRYRIYADITHASGYAQTLTESIEVPASSEAASSVVAPGDAASPPALRLEPDPDDSWSLGVASQSDAYRFDDGSRLVFNRPSELLAGRPVDLTFALRGPDGAPRELERYMGMGAHAAVRRADGSVFVHLHPTGTASMVAQRLFALRDAGRIARAASEVPEAVLQAEMGASAHAVHSLPPLGAAVSLPWAFPQPGSYRLWVQVKSGGRVRTGVYDVRVAPAGV